MDFSKNSLRMRLHNIRPFIVPITEFIDIPVVAEISDLPAGCLGNYDHSNCSRCNIVVRPHFSVNNYVRGVHKFCPWGYTIHHLVCTKQFRGVQE